MEDIELWASFLGLISVQFLWLNRGAFIKGYIRLFGKVDRRTVLESDHKTQLVKWLIPSQSDPNRVITQACREVLGKD